jgi:hypothetical protein
VPNREQEYARSEKFYKNKTINPPTMTKANLETVPNDVEAVPVHGLIVADGSIAVDAATTFVDETQVAELPVLLLHESHAKADGLPSEAASNLLLVQLDADAVDEAFTV